MADEIHEQEKGKTKQLEAKSEMVYIPPGPFLMGSDTVISYSRPVHEVWLDGFYIDKYEVTNAQYAEFLNSVESADYHIPIRTHCGIEKIAGIFKPKKGCSNWPVTYVNWLDAKAYADWAGKRLPTEAEWEKAARGGLAGKKYPWGDRITHDDANYGGQVGKDKWKRAAPVGSFSPNGYGLYDIAGNVWEFCQDGFDPNYYENSPKKNPKGSESGVRRVIRGGSWNDGPDLLNCGHRDEVDQFHRWIDIGFRCVRPAD